MALALGRQHFVNHFICLHHCEKNTLLEWFHCIWEEFTHQAVSTPCVEVQPYLKHPTSFPMTSAKFGRLSSTVHQFLGQDLQSKFHAYEMRNTNQHQHPPTNLPTQGEYEHFHSGWGLWGQQKSPCENLGQTSCICVAYLGKNKCCKYKFTFFGS